MIILIKWNQYADYYCYINIIWLIMRFSWDFFISDIDIFFFFSWAVSTVMTRQNLIPSPDGSRMIHALIPMWDMCNHENGRVSNNTGNEFTWDDLICYFLCHCRRLQRISTRHRITASATRWGTSKKGSKYS